MTLCSSGCLLLGLSCLLAHSHISGYGAPKEEQFDRIECFKCKRQDASCNDGICYGFGCLVIETVYGEHLITQKECLTELPKGDGPIEAKCVRQNLLDNLKTVRCTCYKAYCTGDDALTASGLRPAASSAGKARRGRGIRIRQREITLNYILMLLFVGSFVTFSVMLLVVNTVCSYVC